MMAPLTKVNGKQYYYYDYEFTWVHKWMVKNAKLDMSLANLQIQLNVQPGSYVKATVSEKRVIKGPEVVNKNAIPASVLSKLE